MRKGRGRRTEEMEDLLLSLSIQDTFTSECDIERMTKVDNFDGTFAESWAVPSPRHKCVSCALNGRKASEQERATNKIIGTRYYVLHLPPGTELTEKDRIRVKGKTMQIVSVSSPVSIEAAVTVDLVHIV